MEAIGPTLDEVGGVVPIKSILGNGQVHQVALAEATCPTEVKADVDLQVVNILGNAQVQQVVEATCSKVGKADEVFPVKSILALETRRLTKCKVEVLAQYQFRDLGIDFDKILVNE